MRILLTNDDGVMAPGLAAMRRELLGLGTVEVVAPASPQSAVAHAITIHQPIAARRVRLGGDFEAWSVDGRPVDCVKLALFELLAGRPDLTVSGINAGANAAMNVLYSGTVAAAAEAAFYAVPSVAVSLEMGEQLDFDRAARIAGRIIRSLLACERPWQLVNVNIPSFDRGAPRGVRVVEQSSLLMNERFSPHAAPGQTERSYWLEGDYGSLAGHEHTDLGALADRCVTVTPLRFDLTDRRLLETMRSCDWPDSLE